MSNIPPSPEEMDSRRRAAYERLQKKEWDIALELFLQIFDGSNAPIANCLGFVYDKKMIPTNPLNITQLPLVRATSMRIMRSAASSSPNASWHKP
jgi:hypothetical protein